MWQGSSEVKWGQGQHPDFALNDQDYYWFSWFQWPHIHALFIQTFHIFSWPTRDLYLQWTDFNFNYFNLAGVKGIFFDLWSWLQVHTGVIAKCPPVDHHINYGYVLVTFDKLKWSKCNFVFIYSCISFLYYTYKINHHINAYILIWNAATMAIQGVTNLNSYKTNRIW